jgi:hypothetical protein
MGGISVSSLGSIDWCQKSLNIIFEYHFIYYPNYSCSYVPFSISVGSGVSIRRPGRMQMLTRAPRQTLRVARVVSPMAPSVDGERAEPLANMLFGAKQG